MNPVSFSTIMAGAILLGIAGAAAQGPEQVTKAAIEGWGTLKFGISVQQAKTVMPDLNLNHPECTTQISRNGCTVLYPLSAPIIIDGLDLKLKSLQFDRHDRLIEIVLEYNQPVPVPGLEAKQGVCEENYLRILRPLEAKYGRLTAPRMPPDVATSRDYKPTPGGGYYRSVKGGDFFVLRVINNEQEAEQRLQSRMSNPAITYGPVLDLGAFMATTGICTLTITYASKPPAPENTENAEKVEDLL